MVSSLLGTSESTPTLREHLEAEGVTLCVGVTGPLDAKLAEQVGLETLYATGAGISNVAFGLPDLGLVSGTELLEINRRIVSSTRLPVLADIDTGYGAALQVMRTVEGFERAGVQGVQIEDQRDPKRCGHFDGKRIVPVGDMVERLLAAAEARTDSELVIVARTDARESEGIRGAISRAHAYVEAGADAVFVEALWTREELAIVPAEFEVPAIANMVEGGKTPFLSAPELESLGYRMGLYANTLSRLASAAVFRGLQALKEDGTSMSVMSEMFTWDQRQNAVELPRYESKEESIVERAESLVETLVRKEGDDFAFPDGA